MADGMEKGLSVRDVTVRFERTVAVRQVSLELAPGQVLAVVGPSGCGKSTLLRSVAGLEALASGSVAFAGRDLSRVPPHRRRFALMFQDGQLFGHQSVAGNIGYPLRLKGADRAVVATRVEELLELVGLAGYGNRKPATLSGGEQQRVALARALAAEPQLLLLDEPLSALDRSLRERLASDLRHILTRTGTTTLLVTHDHDEAFTVADRMAVMFDGRVVQEGATSTVWRAPVDARVARFLGYTTVLEDAPARHLLTAATQHAPTPDAAWTAAEAAAASMAPAAQVASGGGALVALRRSALRLDPEGELRGRVTHAAAVPDAIRLDVTVDGVGPVQALAGQDARVEVGDLIRLRLQPSGMAVLQV